MIQSPASPYNGFFGSSALSVYLTLSPREMEMEKKEYEALVANGGRPSHPFEIHNTYLKDPGEYREIISVWSRSAEEWDVFAEQNRHWKDFKNVQEKARFKEPKDDMGTWYGEKRERDTYTKFMHLIPASSNHRFRDYVAMTRSRLRKYNFIRPFHLHANLEEQNQIDTWIEYLGYQYWSLEKVKRSQKYYETMWQYYVRVKVLTPHDTPDSIRTRSYHLASRKSKREAGVAADAALIELKKLQRKKTELSSILLTDEEIMGLKNDLKAAKIKHDEATRKRKSVWAKRRSLTRIVNAVPRYEAVFEEIKRQEILLKWIKQQIPIIESEMKEQEETERSRKRRRSDTDGDERNTKSARKDVMNKGKRHQSV